MNPISPSVPTHHLHISTEFLFFGGMIFLAALVIIAWMVTEMRKPKPSAGRGFEPPQPRPAAPRPPRTDYAPTPSTPRASDYRSEPYTRTIPPRPYAPTPAPASVAAAPASSGISGGEGLLMGLAGGALLDEALHSRQDDPPVVDEAPSYDPGPSYDPPAPSSDSGFSYDSGPGAGSSGGDTSGGLTLDW